MSLPMRSDQELNHLPVLDGFRGIAILSVLMMHCLGLPLGWAGVDLFFVLSGFLITRILISSAGRHGYYRAFYWRRALRILPIYYMLFGIALLFVPQMRNSWWFYFLYAVNLGLFWQSHHVPGFEHIWSLSVEEQFYSLWPAAVNYLGRKGLVVVCVVGFIATVCARLLVARGAHAFAYDALRQDGLFMGALIAIAYTSTPALRERITRVSPFVCVAAVLTVAALGRRNMSLLHPTPLNALLGIPAIALVFVSAAWWVLMNDSSPMASVFKWRWLREIGKVSYGLYLYHVPILHAWKHSQLGQHGRMAGRIGDVLVGGVLSFAVAEFSFHLLEKRINCPVLRARFQVDRSSAELLPADKGNLHPAFVK